MTEKYEYCSTVRRTFVQDCISPSWKLRTHLAYYRKIQEYTFARLKKHIDAYIWLVFSVKIETINSNFQLLNSNTVLLFKCSMG